MTALDASAAKQLDDAPVQVAACDGYVLVTIPCSQYVPRPGDPGEPGLFTDRMSPAMARLWADDVERDARSLAGRRLAVILREAADVAEEPRLKLVQS